jgi:uncharacterized protein YggE
MKIEYLAALLLRRAFMYRIPLALVFVLAAPTLAGAEALKDSTPNIAVTGAAVEDATPDRATLFLGVVTERPNAADAAAENARAAQAVVAELEAQGVAAADIRTVGVTLAPFVSDEPAPRPGAAKRQQKGFRARNELSVTIKALDKAGRIAGQLIDKGANEIEGVTFEVSDAEARLDRLRAAAIKDAERKARIYVEAASLKLARVLEIRPEPDEPLERAQTRFVSFGAGRDAGAATAAIPLEPGAQKLVARVTVTWALSR